MRRSASSHGNSTRCLDGAPNHRWASLMFPGAFPGKSRRRIFRPISLEQKIVGRVPNMLYFCQDKTLQNGPRCMKYNRDTVKDWAGNSQWRALRADFARYRDHGYSGWGSEGFWALLIYRLQKSVHSARPQWLWLPARVVLAIVKKLFTIVTHIGIDHEAEIGPGLLILDCGPIRVHPDTKIGTDCTIAHVVSIGAGRDPGTALKNQKFSNGCAVIGDHVWIRIHFSIIGAVRIGDNATIAANSLVISDVPAGATGPRVPEEDCRERCTTK